MKKVLKLIFIIIFLFIILYISFVIRNVVILTKLDNKVTELNNTKNNIYKAITYTGNPHMGADLKIYKKDEVVKYVTSMKDGSVSITEYCYPEVKRIYTVTKDDKFFDEKNEKFDPVFPAYVDNYTNCINFYDLILSAIHTRIKNVEIDGKKCYQLSGNNSPLFLYYGTSEEYISMELYLEKDTGIPVKQIEKLNIDDNNVEYITDFEYSFDVVTDEDMKEPDKSEYRLLEV